MEGHECRCTCDHDLCVDLRRQRWCRHWFIIQWVTQEHAYAFVVLKRLAALMKTPLDFGRWGSCYIEHDEDQGHEQWRYTILVHLDPAGYGASDEEFERIRDPDPSVVGLPLIRRDCTVWRFRCCGERLREDVPGWILSIVGQSRGETRITFGKENVRWQLESAMESAGVVSFPRD